LWASSYLVLVGVYSSAVSVAQDVKLRQSIRTSVEHQLDLLDKIGTAQMDNEIVKNILSVIKNLSAEIAEQTGVESSLEQGDINDYLVQVMKETKGTKKEQKRKRHKISFEKRVSKKATKSAEQRISLIIICCFFNFHNPLAFDSYFLVIFFNFTFIWRIKYAKHSICLGIEKNVHMSNTKFVFR
jgi:hypothetical protein